MILATTHAHLRTISVHGTSLTLMRAVLLLSLCVAIAAAYDNGMGATPPMGWNTWCTDDLCGLIDLCNEGEIKSVANSIVEQGLDKLGYEYVNMDDCWSAETRNATTNELMPDPDRFPNGMKALADYVHSLGLKIGVYTCVGMATCRHNRPGSYGYYTQDANTLAGWGIDFVKADNCDRPSGISDESLYGNFSDALNATGRPILFSLCNWGEDDVYSWGHTKGQMFRVQMDHLPFWEFPPTAAGEGYGQGVVDIVRYMGYLKPSQYVKQYGWMDPDFLETLFPITMTFTDSRTEYSFWSLWSAPLIVATDVRNLTSDMAYIITNPEVIAIDQDGLYTGGDLVYNATNGGQVWSKPLLNGDVAVILFNPHDVEPIDVTVDWSYVGWKSSDTVFVRDLWAQEDIGNFTGSFKSDFLIPHDVQYVRCSLVTA